MIDGLIAPPLPASLTRAVSFDPTMIPGLLEAYINMTNNPVDGVSLDDTGSGP